MNHNILRVFALAVFATACQSGGAKTHDPSVATPAQAAPQPTQTIAALDADTVQKIICGTTTPCVLTDFKPAGDPAGTLYIAEVAYIAEPAANPGWKGVNFDDRLSCNPWSLFLVDASNSLPKTTKVAHFCNDGHGAAMVGEDNWEVQNGLLTVTTNGGSNWRWGETHILDLKTLRVIARNTDGYFALFHPIFEDNSWDFQKFAGKSTWSFLICETEEQTLENQSVAILSLALPADFVSNGWKSTSLGTCATSLDSAASHGFIVHGQPAANTQDATMKLVVSEDGHLFVEVQDDQLQPSTTGKWIHADHLELWTSSQYVPRMQHECVDPEDKKGTWQWGIDALDGTVHVAHGKPPHKLVAERVAMEGGVRFKVKLPPETNALTVIYSDSDDGKSQERLLATSTFKFARLHTMGSLTPINDKQVTCAVQGGVLTSQIPPISDVLGMAP